MALLWLWYGMVAVAPIVPLAWEHPYATDVALKSKKCEIKNKRGKEMRLELSGHLPSFQYF